MTKCKPQCISPDTLHRAAVMKSITFKRHYVSYVESETLKGDQTHTRHFDWHYYPRNMLLCWLCWRDTGLSPEMEVTLETRVDVFRREFPGFMTIHLRSADLHWTSVINYFSEWSVNINVSCVVHDRTTLDYCDFFISSWSVLLRVSLFTTFTETSWETEYISVPRLLNVIIIYCTRPGLKRWCGHGCSRFVDTFLCQRIASHFSSKIWKVHNHTYYCIRLSCD